MTLDSLQCQYVVGASLVPWFGLVEYAAVAVGAGSHGDLTALSPTLSVDRLFGSCNHQWDTQSRPCCLYLPRFQNEKW